MKRIEFFKQFSRFAIIRTNKTPPTWIVSDAEADYLGGAAQTIGEYETREMAIHEINKITKGEKL